MLSDVALQEFLHWIQLQDADTIEFYMAIVYTIGHNVARSGAPTLAGRKMPLTIKKSFISQDSVQHKAWTLEEKPCMDVGCQRCGMALHPQPRIHGRGGYRFQWQGPWTIDSLVPDGHTSETWRQVLEQRQIQGDLVL